MQPFVLILCIIYMDISHTRRYISAISRWEEVKYKCGSRSQANRSRLPYSPRRFPDAWVRVNSDLVGPLLSAEVLQL